MRLPTLEKSRLSSTKAVVFALAIGTALATGTGSIKSFAEEQTTILAGGCFWCVEADLQKLDGVSDAVSGFSGGTLLNPSYRGNHEGHYEVVEVTYDDEVISYETLLRYFLRHIDPLDADGQFCDRGFSYKTAVFVANEEERSVAEKAIAEIDDLFPEETVATVVLPSGRFWPVEEYHQEFATKNPLRYKYYRWNCGRDQRVSALWEDKAWGRLEVLAEN
ncbi:MAG: peptide-methionine (S)-S-oxide reductase MsrA [Pseudomonadota bacterium]